MKAYSNGRESARMQRSPTGGPGSPRLPVTVFLSQSISDRFGSAVGGTRKRHINPEHINFLKVGTILGQPAGQPEGKAYISCVRGWPGYLGQPAVCPRALWTLTGECLTPLVLTLGLPEEAESRGGFFCHFWAVLSKQPLLTKSVVWKGAQQTLSIPPAAAEGLQQHGSLDHAKKAAKAQNPCSDGASKSDPSQSRKPGVYLEV